MDLLLVLLGTATFPVACLGFVLWMGRIEDSIPSAVRRATRVPDPAPVLAIPVRRPGPPTVTIPAQRASDAGETPSAGSGRRRPWRQRPDGSRSEPASLGGSTNR